MTNRIDPYQYKDTDEVLRSIGIDPKEAAALADQFGWDYEAQDEDDE